MSVAGLRAGNPQLGLKSVAVYRDGSKLGQPLTADEDQTPPAARDRN